MKKVGDIMKEMGFNSEAPDSVKEAFVRHLIKVSTGVEVAERKRFEAQVPKKSAATNSNKHEIDKQLIFDFNLENEYSPKKAV